jgi:two-component system nitrate/nitrite response regulator NarL
VADAIAQGAQGFVVKEKPIGVVIEAVELAHQGYLAVDPLLLQAALRPHVRSDDPLWVLKFLTEREWQVMRCLIDGLSTQEIADRLCVQRSTARTHVQNLLIKLGVHSRLQAAALMTAHASEVSWPVQMR